MEYLDRGTDVPTGSDKQLTPTAEGPFTAPKPKTDAWENQSPISQVPKNERGFVGTSFLGWC